MNVLVEMIYSFTAEFEVPDDLSDAEQRKVASKMADKAFDPLGVDWVSSTYFKDYDPDSEDEPEEWFDL